jgi:hypothetical protein
VLENVNYIPSVTMLEANHSLYMAMGGSIFGTDFTVGPCQICCGPSPDLTTQLASGLSCPIDGTSLQMYSYTAVREMNADASYLYFNGPHQVNLASKALVDLAAGGGPFFMDASTITWLGDGGPANVDGGALTSGVHRVAKSGGAPQVLVPLTFPKQSFPIVHGNKTFAWVDGTTLYAIVAN